MEEVIKENEIIETVDTQEVETVEVVEEVEATKTMEEELEELKQTIADRDKSIAKLEENAKAEALRSSLEAEGLLGFEGLFTSTDATEQIKIIKQAVNDILIKKSYVPKEQIKQTEYENAIQNNDVQGAIKSKFSKIFGI